jgi:hypothetical protein
MDICCTSGIWCISSESNGYRNGLWLLRNYHGKSKSFRRDHSVRHNYIPYTQRNNRSGFGS